MFKITDTCSGCHYCVSWCPVKAIHGRKKQRHSIDDTCISCGSCGRICGFQAVVDHQDVIQRRIQLSQWPKPVWNYEFCDSCEACVRACPVGCIRMVGEPSQPGAMLLPKLITPKRCIACGFCGKACDKKAITMRVVQ